MGLLPRFVSVRGQLEHPPAPAHHGKFLRGETTDEANLDSLLVRVGMEELIVTFCHDAVDSVCGLRVPSHVPLCREGKERTLFKRF